MNLTDREIREKVKKIGMNIPIFMPALQYFENNINDYNSVRTRSPHTLIPSFEQLRNVNETTLSYFTDNELFDMFRAYVGYTSRKQLIRFLLDLVPNNGKLNHSFFYPGKNPNCTKIKNPKDIIVAYGNIYSYICYTIEKLPGMIFSMFPENPDQMTKANSYDKTKLLYLLSSFRNIKGINEIISLLMKRTVLSLSTLYTKCLISQDKCQKYWQSLIDENFEPNILKGLKASTDWKAFYINQNKDKFKYISIYLDKKYINTYVIYIDDTFRIILENGYYVLKNYLALPQLMKLNVMLKINWNETLNSKTLYNLGVLDKKISNRFTSFYKTELFYTIPGNDLMFRDGKIINLSSLNFYIDPRKNIPLPISKPKEKEETLPQIECQPTENIIFQKKIAESKYGNIYSVIIPTTERYLKFSIKLAKIPPIDDNFGSNLNENNSKIITDFNILNLISKNIIYIFPKIYGDLLTCIFKEIGTFKFNGFIMDYLPNNIGPLLFNSSTTKKTYSTIFVNVINILHKLQTIDVYHGNLTYDNFVYNDQGKIFLSNFDAAEIKKYDNIVSLLTMFIKSINKDFYIKYFNINFNLYFDKQYPIDVLINTIKYDQYVQYYNDKKKMIDVFNDIGFISIHSLYYEKLGAKID